MLPLLLAASLAAPQADSSAAAQARAQLERAIADLRAGQPEDARRALESAVRCFGSSRLMREEATALRIRRRVIKSC